MLAVCARAIALVWRKSAGERAEVIGEDSAAEIGAGGRGRSGFAHELGSVFEIDGFKLPAICGGEADDGVGREVGELACGRHGAEAADADGGFAIEGVAEGNGVDRASGGGHEDVVEEVDVSVGRLGGEGAGKRQGCEERACGN